MVYLYIAIKVQRDQNSVYCERYGLNQSMFWCHG